jgi:ABC-type transporter Mla subunit MlaD
LPEDPVFELALNKNRHYELRILPGDGKLVAAPEPGAFFTVENPLRMKRFLEIQMESAEALKLTNDKINQLMSDETISTLQSTVKNTELLTARAGGVLDSARELFRTTQAELGRLVSVSEQLAENVSSVSRNVNEIVGDPRLRSELSSTVSSLRNASHSMQTLLDDPALKETILNAQSASVDAAELTRSLRQTWGSPVMQQRLDRVSNQLDVSLVQLNRVLSTVEQSVDGKDERLKGIVEDTRATAQNLRAFSDKLKGRFTLFKLLF